MASPPTALVLGAGIMGLSAAWGLARRGFAVRIVEQDAIPNPRGSSVDHHRLIRHAYGAQAGYMRMVDPAYAAWDMVWRDLGEVLHIRTGVLAVSGSAMIFFIAAASFSFTGSGVPAGTISAFQAETSKPAMPCSATDLISGRERIAWADVTAIGLTLPICPRVAATVSISTGT